MKNTLFVLATVCGIVLLGGFQNLVSAELPIDLCATTQSFDRESCEADCRTSYGADPYVLQFRGGIGIGGGWGTGRYQGAAQCIQQCNDRFWKEFDREHQ
jgi:hypothetical protein